MKKIGVITTQYSPNYGALLQTFALQKYLKKHYSEKEIEVINYFPEHSKKFWDIFPNRKGWKNKLLAIYLFLHPQYIKAKKERLSKLKKFVEDNISCSKAYSEYEELEQLEMEYDTLICGSDQIWNITRHDDPAWFLYFSKEWKECTKIAYAPSVADKIPAGHEEHLKEYLQNLDFISVRESSDIEQLKKYTSKEIWHVCDPVFLLSAQEWSEYFPKVDIIKEPYILCYFISAGDFAADVVKKIRNLTGIKVVYINVNIRDKFNADYDERIADPADFVNYIKNARYVCTNSFHCTAFSILFKKDFLVVPKQSANSRMKSMIDKAGIENRFIYKEKINDLNIQDLEVDYSKCNLEQWIKESKDYLNEAIEYNE